MCPSWGLPKYIKTKDWPLAFTSCKSFFKKNKKRSGTSHSSWFYAWFLKEKYFSRYISLTDQVSLHDCHLFPEILGNICIVVISWPVCDVVIFEINQSFLITPFFYITKKLGQNVSLLGTKRASNMKYETFFIIFKKFSIARNCIRPENGPLWQFKRSRSSWPQFSKKWMSWKIWQTLWETTMTEFF